MEICIDFDGTCVTHDYPQVGKDIEAAPVLRRLVERGHKLILFTMRSEDTLIPAINWFSDNFIPLYGLNKNPTQSKWTSSLKAYGQLYIDDAALGCPLIHDTTVSNRPYVDWKAVEEWLEKNNVL
jgi:hypothetical protein